MKRFFIEFNPLIMKNSWNPIIALFFIAAILVGCKEEPKPAPLAPTTTAVLVGSEGLIAAGTATLASYDPKGKVLENYVFQKANNYNLGNTINSILVDDDKIFLVLSGTGEIIVVDKDTHEVIRRIAGLGAPRHIMKVAESKYYISDWQLEGIHVYSYLNQSMYPLVTGKGPENMVQYGDLAFVANGGDGNNDSIVTVIDTRADTIMAEIKVGYNPNSLQVDVNDKLWVLCSGILDQNSSASISGNLISFDLSKDSLIYNIKDSLIMADSLVITDNQMRPVRLQINPTGDMLYWLDNKTGANLMRHNVFFLSDPSTSPFVVGSFYGLDVDPIEGDIYATDALDNIQNGDLHRYNESGAQLDMFKVGITPVCFGFK